MMGNCQTLDWDEMLPLAEAAALSGLSAQTLKLQAERGRLQARKMAGRWLTTRRWLQSYMENRARKGRAEWLLRFSAEEGA